MEIHLSPAAERFVENQLRLGLHQTASAVIDSLILEKERGQNGGSPDARALAQKADLLALIKECEESSESEDPGFSNRDHDRILYGHDTRS